MTIALASASPRRRELLTQLGVDFQVVKIDVDETQAVDEPAAVYVQRLAIAKSQAGWQAGNSTLPTLGADTIVVVDSQVLGKPQNQADFLRMMTLLSGRVHQVMTAIALTSRHGTEVKLVTTDVWFTELTEAQMLDYWQTGEPQDKAGGYGIQGIAGRFVEKIHGSYFAVVGLPLFETAQLLGSLSKAD